MAAASRERRRDRLQRREVEDHEEAGFLPDRDDDHARERGRRVCRASCGWQAERAGDLLEQAVLRRVEEEPDVGHRDHRQHRRREERHAQEGAARAWRSFTHSAITIASAIESGIVASANQRLFASDLPEHRVARPSPGSSRGRPTRGPARPWASSRSCRPDRAERRPVREGASSASAGSSSSQRVDACAMRAADAAAIARAVTWTTRRMRSASRCASFIACAGVLAPVSAAWRPSLSALVTRWLSCVESSATEYCSWSRATARGREARHVLLHLRGLPRVGTHGDVARVDAPLRGALGLRHPLDELERGRLLRRSSPS